MVTEIRQLERTSSLESNKKCLPVNRIGKNCARGLEYGAAGRGPWSRPQAQFFPIWTDPGRQITCLFFPLWKITL